MANIAPENDDVVIELPVDGFATGNIDNKEGQTPESSTEALVFSAPTEQEQKDQQQHEKVSSVTGGHEEPSQYVPTFINLFF